MSRSLKVNKYVLVLILVLWVFVPPSYLNSIGSIKTIINLLSMVLSFSILFFSINRIKNTPSKMFLLIITFYLQLILITIIQNGDWRGSIKYCLPVIVVCFFYQYYSNKWRVAVIKAMFWIHYLFVIINFVTVIVFPNGLPGVDRNEAFFFLGHNNAAARFLLPAIAYSLLNDYIDGKKVSFHSFLLAIMSFATVTFTWSNTGMVGIGIILIIVVISRYIELPKYWNVKNVFIVACILFFIVVLGNTTGFLSYIVENIFHKDLTFTGRTTIWNAMIINIRNNPIWGYGYGVEVWKYASMGKMEPSSAHNYFLDLLFRGGIIHLLIQILMIVQIGKRMYLFSEKLIVQLMTGVFASYFIMWQFEPFVNAGYLDMMLLFLISYMLPEIERNGHIVKIYGGIENG